MQRMWPDSSKRSAAAPRHSSIMSVQCSSPSSSQRDTMAQSYTAVTNPSIKDSAEATSAMTSPPRIPAFKAQSAPQYETSGDSDALATNTSTSADTTYNDCSTAIKPHISSTTIDTDLVVDICTQQTTCEVSRDSQGALLALLYKACKQTAQDTAH